MNMYVHSFVIVPDLFRAVFHCAANPDIYGHKVNENFYTSVEFSRNTQSWQC